jgi:shikimate kinase
MARYPSSKEGTLSTLISFSRYTIPKPTLMPVQRIYLVGFMGAGKSTVGRELSLKLHWPFLDLDAEIESATQLSVREIFERFGEPHFRELEREHLKRLSETPQAVIALGGGAFIDASNRAVVEASGVAVWLDVSLSTIKERVRPDGTRPLMKDFEQLRMLYERRRPSYKLAGVHVRTDNRLPDAIAEEIVQRVTTS